jgi:hypothetical protein
VDVFMDHAELLKKQYEFSGAFVKVLKVTITFVIPVRPSVRLSAWNNSAPTALISIKFNI